MITGEIENGVVQRGYTGGFSGSIFTDTGGAIVFNLYTNPQEDVSDRHPPYSHGGTAGDDRRLVFEGAIRVPAAIQGRLHVQQPAASTTCIPDGEMALKAWLKKHGFGCFQN